MRSSSTRLSPVPELSKALGELFSKWGFGLSSQSRARSRLPYTSSTKDRIRALSD